MDLQPRASTSRSADKENASHPQSQSQSQRRSKHRTTSSSTAGGAEGTSKSHKRSSGSSAGHGRDEAKMIGQWRIGRTIGKGSSGRVKIAKHAITGKYAAIKIVPKGLILTSRMSMSEAGARADKVLLGIEREIVIMKLIDHPNVLNLYDVWETSGELYLIMEYVPGGELFDYLVKRGRLPETEALEYFQQIIHAVDYCHRFNICHRDLKPENLLLDKDKNIKVADFGMAAWEAGERLLETSCGSPHYASPEIVAGRAYHGSSSDIWSCGIILFALITGRLPFDDDNIRNLLLKVKTGVFEMPQEVRGPVRDLLFRMLEKEPEKRITMSEILVHPFFTSQAPKGIVGRELVPPPSLDEVERPVHSREEVDPDILGNLKTLWHGAADDDIIQALLSKDKTWEKAIYHLLIKYRTRHLENYNVDDDEKAASPTAAKGKGVHGRPAPPPPTRSALGDSARANIIQPVQSSATPLPTAKAIPAQDSPPKRPSAPTPTKAASLNPTTGLGPSLAERMAKLNLPRMSPIGPRPPLSPRVSYPNGSVPTTPLAADHTPSIVLQPGTPETARDYFNVPLAPPLADKIAYTRPATPLESPIIQSETQMLYDEVAQQLQTMSARSSVVSTATAAGPRIVTSARKPIPDLDHVESPSHGSDDSRFADAEEDESDNPAGNLDDDAYSTRSTVSATVGLGLGHGIPTGLRSNSRPTSSDGANKRWSVASGTSTQHRSSIILERTPSAPAPPMAEYLTVQPTVPVQSQRPAPSIPNRGGPPARPSLQATQDSLARDSSYVYVEWEPESPETTWQDSQSSRGSAASSMAKWGDNSLLKRRKQKPAPIITSGAPQPFSPDLSGNSSGSPKRSWFQNLFNFKPAPYTLWSHESIADTTTVVQKHLVSFGIRVAVERMESLTVLRCKVETMRDHAGQVVLNKPVLFKVEILKAASPSRYATGVSLALIKGAQSSFKEICIRLRRDYKLDGSGRGSALPSPVTPVTRIATIQSPRLPMPAFAPASQEGNDLFMH